MPNIVKRQQDSYRKSKVGLVTREHVSSNLANPSMGYHRKIIIFPPLFFISLIFHLSWKCGLRSLSKTTDDSSAKPVNPTLSV